MEDAQYNAEREREPIRLRNKCHCVRGGANHYEQHDDTRRGGKQLMVTALKNVNRLTERYNESTFYIEMYNGRKTWWR